LPEVLGDRRQLRIARLFELLLPTVDLRERPSDHEVLDTAPQG
jgi:hypothetical protein